MFQLLPIALVQTTETSVKGKQSLILFKIKSLFETTEQRFDYETGTQVYGSCAITFKNEYFIFGGNSEYNQLAKIVDCKLQKIGKLIFNHYNGGCANMADERKVLYVKKISKKS